MLKKVTLFALFLSQTSLFAAETYDFCACNRNDLVNYVRKFCAQDGCELKKIEEAEDQYGLCQDDLMTIGSCSLGEAGLYEVTIGQKS